MIQTERLFENFFENKNIIPSRLLNFGQDTLNHLTAANDKGSFTDLINLLTGPLQDLAAELGGVDTSLNVQKGATLTNNQVLQLFKDTMSNEEPFIARALEGKNTPAYLQFYPQGVSEYVTASKTNMPVLTSRVNVAATAFAGALGASLTATLQAFESNWLNSRNSQQQQMGTVEDSRSGRSEARTAVELALVNTLHTIGAMFPGNVAQCSAFFDFTLLLPKTKHRHKNFAGIIAAGQTVQVLNQTFTDSSSITLRNPDDNAAIAVWLSPTANGEMPESFVQVQPGHAKDVRPSELGSLKNTFLLINNLSAVNEGAYEVVVIG